jgi:hypothetical protein
MLANNRDQILGAFDRLHAAVSELAQLSFDVLTTPERLALLERLEQEARRLPIPRHQLINGVRRQATAGEIGGALSHVLADRLRITRAEASRRIDEAADLGARQSITGEPLAPQLPATAAGQRAGAIDAAHVKVIRGFLRELPCWVDADTRAHAEAQLADFATQYRPELLGKTDRQAGRLPESRWRFQHEDRARRRGLILGKQEADGMSTLRGYLTPAARAAVEAVLAKLAAPVGLGELGQHNGLPASIIVTTSLRELEAGAGKALTGGGSLLPMTDVVRLARHAHHYLAIFDKGRAIGLYHTKRWASPGQRIVLYAKDRGCPHPGCDVSGYYCEVHHVTDYSICHTTDIDESDLQLRQPPFDCSTWWLADAQAQRRSHRMDSPSASRAGAAPCQPFSRSREATGQRRRRRVLAGRRV